MHGCFLIKFTPYSWVNICNYVSVPQFQLGGGNLENNHLISGKLVVSALSTLSHTLSMQSILAGWIDNAYEFAVPYGGFPICFWAFDSPLPFRLLSNWGISFNNFHDYKI